MENVMNRVNDYITESKEPVSVIITGPNLVSISRTLEEFSHSVGDYIFHDQYDFTNSAPQRGAKNKAKASLILTSATTDAKTLRNIIKLLKNSGDKVLKIYSNSATTTLAVI